VDDEALVSEDVEQVVGGRAGEAEVACDRRCREWGGVAGQQLQELQCVGGGWGVLSQI
jgi:hypothetical protein